MMFFIRVLQFSPNALLCCKMHIYRQLRAWIESMIHKDILCRELKHLHLQTMPQLLQRRERIVVRVQKLFKSTQMSENNCRAVAFFTQH